MSTDAGKKARETAANYEKALKYLDSASELNASVFQEANRIAGMPFDSTQMQQMIDQSALILPIGGNPGGLASLRDMFRKNLVEGISTFNEVADKLGAPQGSAGGGSGKSSCFIATAVYGTPFSPEIDCLRNFRDSVLMQSPKGRSFVSIYERASPPFAAVIAVRPWLRLLVRHALIQPLLLAIKVIAPHKEKSEISLDGRPHSHLASILRVTIFRHKHKIDKST